MPTRAAGRPRTFDRDLALRDAARLFWRHGYSGTSTRMLTTALGISSSSLYAAFGSKERLFDEAVRAHTGRYGEVYARAVQEPDLAGVIERVLVGSVDEFTRPDDQPGCLTTSAAMADTSATLDVRAFVVEAQGADEALLRARVERAVVDGDAPAGTDAGTLTGLVQTLWHGLAVRAELGAGREELRAAARLAAARLAPPT
ncbi:TetR/AcrR family transcriptional regulator [Isoptericola sp. NPDC058082]|uniref:TetR/AcrR family transcriptional regulator n=1 Tax=Isoptericola sp. NPDC058082 TaxID=3346331 RepID=UPI0036E2DF9F